MACIAVSFANAEARPHPDKPDPRFRSLVHVDVQTGRKRPIEIADLHAMMEPLELGAAFDTARHAFVYSWFCYDLATLAEAHAYGALENGLRMRAKAAEAEPERSGMKGLLKLAVRSGWLPEAEFDHLIDILPMLRNHLQHGQPHLNPRWQPTDAMP
jgi:hypothetical protein